LSGKFSAQRVKYPFYTLPVKLRFNLSALAMELLLIPSYQHTHKKFADKQAAAAPVFQYFGGEFIIR
jgi:hypothetical protein